MTLSERFIQSKKQAMIQKMNQDKPSVVIVMTKEPETPSMDLIEHLEEMKSMENEEEKEVEVIEEFTNSISTFLGSLKSFEVLAKLLHWKTTSYAKHIALDELVESLGSLTDQLVEKSQIESLLDLVVLETKIENSEIEHVREMLEYVRTNRSVFKYTFESNIVDEIESALSTALYKLNQLH